MDNRKAWMVWWNEELGRGWLWGIRMLADGCVPRRFEPPD